MQSSVELGTLGTNADGYKGDPIAINSSGQVVGITSKYDTGVYKNTRAVRWDSNGIAIELGTLDPQNASVTYANDINDSGQAIGYVLYKRCAASRPGEDQGRATWNGLNESGIECNTFNKKTALPLGTGNLTGEKYHQVNFKFE